MAETFTIIKNRRNRTTEITGDLDYLRNYFAYTLSAGNSYDSKVKLTPASAKTLVSSLNRAVDSLEKGSYNPTYYELANS